MFWIWNVVRRFLNDVFLFQTISVDECVLGGRINPTLLDSTCTSEINDEGLVEISTDLSDCGTTMEFSKSDDFKKFSVNIAKLF